VVADSPAVLGAHAARRVFFVMDVQPSLPMELPEQDDNDLLRPDDELSRRHTAERVAQVADRRDGILRALGCGLPFTVVCEVFACAPATVAALASTAPQLVEAGKKRLAGKFQVLSHAAVDAALIAVQEGRMPAASLPVCAGIAADKSLVLSGEPSLVIEHRHTSDPRALAAAAAAWIDVASSVLPQIGAESDDAGAVGGAVEPARLARPAPGAGHDPAAQDDRGGGVGLAVGARDDDALPQKGHDPKDLHE
jgi:hypothetical protein